MPVVRGVLGLGLGTYRVRLVETGFKWDMQCVEFRENGSDLIQYELLTGLRYHGV
jgi:hypothetical protein